MPRQLEQLGDWLFGGGGVEPDGADIGKLHQIDSTQAFCMLKTKMVNLIDCNMNNVG
jgi:hypothetical protein